MGKMKQDFTPDPPKARRSQVVLAWLIILIVGCFVVYMTVDSLMGDSTQTAVDLPQMPTATPIPPGSQVIDITINDIGNEEAAPAPTAPPQPTPDVRIDELAAVSQDQSLTIERLENRVNQQETAVAELAGQMTAGMEEANSERDELADDVERMERQQTADYKAIVSYGGGVFLLLVLAVGSGFYIVSQPERQPNRIIPAGTPRRDRPTQEPQTVYTNQPVNTVITPELQRNYTELPEVEGDPVITGITGNSAVITPVNEPRFEFYDLLNGYFTNSEIALISSRGVDKDSPPDWFIRGVRKMDNDPSVTRTQISAAVRMNGRNFTKLKHILDGG